MTTETRQIALSFAASLSSSTSVEALIASAQAIENYLNGQSDPVDQPLEKASPTKATPATKPSAASTKPTSPAASPKTPASTTVEQEPSSSDGSTEDATSADGTETADLSNEDVVKNLRVAANAAVLAAVKPTALGRDLTVKALGKFNVAKATELAPEQLQPFAAYLDPSNYDAIRGELG